MHGEAVEVSHVVVRTWHESVCYNHDSWAYRELGLDVIPRFLVSIRGNSGYPSSGNNISRLIRVIVAGNGLGTPVLSR